MSHRCLRYFLLVIMLMQPIFTDGNPAPKKSSKMAFGAGLLGGALGGAALNHALSQKNPTEQHVYHHFGDTKAAPQPPQLPSRTVTNGPLLANGCYEQTIHEPNLHVAGQFTETVHLICSAVVPGAAVAQPVMPQTPLQGYPPQNPPLVALTYPQQNPQLVPQAVPQQNPPVAPQAVPQHNPPLAPIVEHQPPHNPAVVGQPAQQSVPQQPSPQGNSPAMVPAAPQQNPPVAPHLMPSQNPSQYPPQNPPQVVAAQNPPSVPTQLIPQQVSPQLVPQQPTSQVYVLSKKTGYYSKSTATTTQPIYITLWVLSIVMIFLSNCL